MIPVLRTIFPLPPAANHLTRWRVIALYVGVVFYLLSRLAFVFSSVPEQTAELLDWSTTVILAIQGMFLLLAGFVWLNTRRDSIQLASGVLVSMLLIESTIYLFGGAWNTLQGWCILWLAVTLGIFLFETRASAVLLGFGFVLITLAAFHDLNDLSVREQNWRYAVYLTMVLSLLALIVLLYNVIISTRRTTQLLPQDNAQILMTIGDNVAQSLFKRQELDSFLEFFTQILVEHLPTVYHAEVYLIKTDSQVATLAASTGAVGQQLLAQEHELDIGGLSAVGRAALTQKPLVIQDYQRGTPLRPHPLLPYTRAEVAMPLLVDDRMIGILDVQSMQPDAFPSVDLAFLQSIGNQLTIALDSLQLHEESQRNVRENRALYQQTQANLREIERLNYQLTGSAWSDYLRAQHEAAAVTLDIQTGQTTGEAEWTPTLNEAATHQQVITVINAGRRTLALPIVVRNETVGAMEFELESDEPLPEEVFDLAAAVGQRLGLALENRRLFDETQRAAQREALINDIGAELQTATGVDMIIQQTARQLQEVLAPQQITIRLGKSGAEQPESTKRGKA